MGALGVDVLYGGEGNDQLWGENRSDGWIGRVADGTGAFISVAQQEFYSVTGAADYLDGGAGDDYLRGDGGSDVLVGGGGIDVLYGDDEFVAGVIEGDDFLDGGTEDDYLQGGGGRDVLIGGAGLDTLIGDYVGWPALGADDILDGGAGIDHLLGGGGDDTLFGGADADILWGDAGQDVMDGGSGNDELQGGTEADVLWGGTGNDLLFGEDGNDQLFGDEDNDVLLGEAGVDELVGGAGDDQLQGGDGDDVLIGGAGTDTLLGGLGADTYVFNLGDGVEIIQDTAGEGNKIVFGAGISAADISVGIGSLVVRVGLTSDAIHIQGFDPATPTVPVGIETFEFADGTTLTQADLVARGFDLVGTADHDALDGGQLYQRIYGLEGDDSLTGGTGDNLLDGGTGNDALSGLDGADTLVGEAGNDTLNGGTGDDILIGGIGADRLQGGAGQDRYLFNPGDGADLIVDTAGEGNRVVFGAGITAGSVTLRLAGESALAIHTGQPGDQIQIISNLSAVDRSAVDIVEFADGSTLSVTQLLAQGIAITGTADGDVLTGTVREDRISGLGGDDIIDGGLGGDRIFGNEGNDQLLGGEGSDELDGGQGDDVLDGGAGEDTYVFGRGYGQDIVNDSPVEQDGPNRIQLTNGVSSGDVRLQARRSDDRVNVVLTIEGSPDELTLSGTAAPSLLQISEIRFADGTSWDMAQILDRIEGVQVTASAFGSELEGSGFRDVLMGAAGNDSLDGRGGADRMVGGGGDDWYLVEHSGDTVVEALGEGQDAVSSQIDYTLPDHVENLFLSSTAQPITDPVRGEGNASDNVLHGNFVNNVLIGGGGDDLLYGGFSIGSDYGPGDDDLHGGAGSDTYFVEGSFNGFDTIHDVALPGEGNRLQFGTSVRPDEVVFVQESSRLRITNSGATDGVILENFDPTGAVGSLVTEVVAFSSGVEDVTRGYEVPLLALMHPTVGTDSAEILTGTANAEVIKAQGGDDVIAGGAGNDVLIGGTGSDTYVFNQGDGFDLIDDQSGAGDVNLIQFGAGITPDMLRVIYSGTFSTSGLSVRIGTSGDGLHFLGVSADDPNAPHAIDRFQFAGGAQLTFAELFEREILVQGTGRSDGELFGTFADDFMQGLSGSEFLSSGTGDDILIGGTGNDVLAGGAGSDTYVFNLGDGSDEIHDEISDQFSPDVNRIRFGVGITASDLVLSTAPGALRDDVSLVTIGTSGDRIVLPNFVDFIPALTIAEFADGITLNLYSLNAANQRTDNQTITGGAGDTVLIGGSGNDTIIAGDGTTTLLGGAGNDTLVGGSGHNWISGGPGNDFMLGGNGGNTFLLSPGSGRDSIQIPNFLVSLHSSEVRFSGGYHSYHPSLSLGSLVIRYGDLGDELHLLDFDPNDVFARPAVQRFEFSDRVLTYEELIALGFDIEGTGSDDVLTGTNTTDRFTGFAGNDILNGGAGTDTLTGGQGNDSLRGGAGYDTYLFKLGDGIDTIQDVAAVGEGNRIQFGLGISQSDLTFTQDDAARMLTIQVGASGADRLILRNFDLTGANGTLVAETLVFADGSTANLAALLGGVPNQAPAVASPIADQTVPEGTPLTLQIPANTFVDPDAGDVLTYSATLADGSALPTWLSFHPMTRTFSGTPDDAQVGNLDLRVTATDTGNLTASDIFTLTVQNVNEAPAVAVPLANQQATEDAPFSVVVPATTFADPDAGDVLSYSATVAGGAALPAWLSFAPVTRTFSGTPLNGDVGSLDIAVKATDLAGLSATDTFALAIRNVNDAPTMASPIADQQATQGTAFSLVVAADTFVDEDAGDVLTYSATLANGSALPTWLSFNPTTRTFSGTPGSGDAGVLTIKVTATDTGTLSVFDLFDVTVQSQDQILTGTAGNDVLAGGVGNDQLFGLAGNDTLVGGAGHDLLDGGTGIDTMVGGTGDDTYVVDAAGDVVTELANEGVDTVQTALPTYTLGANVENLTLTGMGPSAGIGNALSNVLIGNSGANVLDGGAGADTMAGGAGDDVYVVDNAGDVVTELANEGTDTVMISVTYSLSANVEHMVLTGSAAIHGTGNDLDNVLTGNSAANVLTGLGGNDTYVIGAGDTVVEAVGGGIDTVISTVTHQLAANVENLTLLGLSTIAGTGNALDNILNGATNLDANVLTGGAGNDTYIVGAGDTVVEAAGGGTDTVQSAITWTLGANLENLTLTGTAAINGTGNSLNNVLTGNSAANVLTGGAGNDTYIVGAGDSIVENANAGTDTVQSAIAWTLGANLENLTLTGTGIINGTGNTLNNVLTGNSANNVLTGLGGNDTYQYHRGGGQDTVVDNSGTADTMLFGATINPLDLVLSRQANNLRLAIHGSSDQVTVQNWYAGATNQTETIQAGNGQTLLNTQVDQLIQAMASFTSQTGLSWDAAAGGAGTAAQQAQFQGVLAANWQ